MYEEQLIKIWAQRNKYRVNLDNQEEKVSLYFRTEQGRELYVKAGLLPMKAIATVRKPTTIAEDPVSLEQLSERFLQLYGGQTMYYYTSNGRAVRGATVPCISPVPFDYSNQIKHE